MKLTVKVFAVADKINELPEEVEVTFNYPLLDLPVMQAGGEIAVVVKEAVEKYIKNEKVGEYDGPGTS